MLLRIDEETGGRSHVSEDGYLEGAPELIAEVAASGASLEMQDKLRAYRRSGVREYIVWRTEEKSIEWFELADGECRPLPRDERGVIESRVFGGLRLATDALIAGNLAAVLAEVDKGIESPRHREFVARLAPQRVPLPLRHRRAMLRHPVPMALGPKASCARTAATTQAAS